MNEIELPGRLRERYRVIRLLGRGGMGAVYLAHDLALDRPLALKVLELDGADGDLPQRFRREAQAVATLSHPNVVRIHDSGADGPLAWIAMEHLTGGSLEDLLFGDAPSREDAAALLAGIVAGLAHVHDAGLLHRDLKPSNVMLREGAEPVLVDFGLARRITGDQTPLTIPGTVVGSIAYLAPEVILGQEITAAADVFQVAALGHALLTGKDLHGTRIGRPAVALPAVFANLTRGTYLEAARVALAPHGALGELLLRGLAQDPQVRCGLAELAAGLLGGEAEAEAGEVSAERPVASPVRGPGKTRPRTTRARASAAVVQSTTQPGGGDRRVVAVAGLLAVACGLLALGLRGSQVAVRPPVESVAAASPVSRSPSPSPREISPAPPLPASTADLVALAAKVRAWAARKPPLEVMRALGRGDPALRTRSRTVAARYLASFPIAADAGPLPLLAARADPREAQLYQDLFYAWRLADLVRAEGGPAPSLAALFPAYLTPGALPDAGGRRVDQKLDWLPLLNCPSVNSFSLEEVAFVDEGSGRFADFDHPYPDSAPRFGFLLSQPGRARTVHIVIAAPALAATEFVHVEINRALKVGVVSANGDPARLATSLPLWALREGPNLVRLGLGSIVPRGTDDSISARLTSFRLVVAP